MNRWLVVLMVVNGHKNKWCVMLCSFSLHLEFFPSHKSNYKINQMMIVECELYNILEF